MKTAKDVNEPVLQFATDRTICLNAIIIDATKSKTFSVIVKKKKTVSYRAMAAAVASEFSADNISLDKLTTKLWRLQKEFTNLTKYPERNWSSIEAFLCTPLDFSTCVEDHANVLQPADPANSEVLHCETSSVSKSEPTPSQTRSSCKNEVCKNLKTANSSLLAKLCIEKRKTREQKKIVRDIKQKYNVKTVNQKHKRWARLIKNQKIALKEQNSFIENLKSQAAQFVDKANQLSVENRKLKKENEKLKSDLKVNEQKLKETGKMIRKTETLVDFLESSLCEKEEESFEIHSKNGKQYSDNVRHEIYRMLLCNVPVVQCGYILGEVVKTFTGKQLSSVPCASTASQMAYELGVLGSIQVVEFLLAEKPLCLSWDATTVDGAHINEIHVTANKNSCMCLDVSQLPGGKTHDYVSHIVDTLMEATQVYARHKQEGHETILATVYSNISCTLTDRAAVNACVTRELCTQLETQLTQLNCNVHPLDSVSRYSIKGLIALDRENAVEGKCKGFDGTAGNLIRALSVLRYKDGKGDPMGFKNILRKNNLALGTFVRCVGSRIHVLFHQAGIIILHKDIVLEFIENSCHGAAALKTCLQEDLQNPRILVQVWALGVIGKVFSGPWMSRTYSSQLSSLELGPFVQCCLEKVNGWLEHPEELLKPTTNVFDEALDWDRDSVMSALMDFCTEENNLQISAIHTLLSAVQTVLHQQMVDYITGEFAKPSKSLLESTRCAPTNNMESERALGLLDNIWRKAPNATLGFLSGKVKCKLNKTLWWLENKDPKERENLLKFAVSEARSERFQGCLKKKNVLTEIEKRREAVAKEKFVKKRNSLSTKINSAFSKSEFSQICSLKHVSKMREFLDDMHSLVGKLAFHSVDDCDYYLRVLDVKLPTPKKKSRVIHLCVSYWLSDEREANSVDHKISAGHFFADVELGAIVFL